MSDILLNADAAEGRPESPEDLELLEAVDVLNLALGGHAGEPAWTRALAHRAEARGVRVLLHPGYPDRAAFGRRDTVLPWPELSRALERQRAVLPEVSGCKFHGSLYSQAMADASLAARLVQWSIQNGITLLVALPDSALERRAREAGLEVWREAFADRAYTRRDGPLRLLPRSEAGAVHTELETAFAQAVRILDAGEVPLREGVAVPLTCETLCLHGDGPYAVALARRLRAHLGGGR
jgi:UPF0271 protein